MSDLRQKAVIIPLNMPDEPRRVWLIIQLRGAALMLRRAERPVSKHEGVSRDHWRPLRDALCERSSG
jgi:hypothetical protein